MATSKQLRARAAAIGESLMDMVATSNRIGEADGWQGARYDAIQRDLAKYRTKRAALLADAAALETKTAA